MRETKRRIEALSFYDHTGIAAHLEAMAAKGWMIDAIAGFGWKYRRIEPKRLHFAVSYYPKASEFDPEPSEDLLRFREFCEHTGWKLVVSAAQMQIFCNEQEHPIPIETDPVLEVETLHRAAKKSFLPAYFVLLAIALLNGALFVSRLLGDPIGLFSSSSNCFTGLSWTLLMLLCIVELGGYFRWRSRAKKAAARGEFLDTPNTSRFQRIILWIVLIALAYHIVTFLAVSDSLMRWLGLIIAVYMIALLVLVNSIKQLLKRRRVSAGINRTVTVLASFVLSFLMMGAITYFGIHAVRSGFFEPEKEIYEYHGQTWVLHQDTLPLTVEDLLEVEFDGYIRERRSSESLFLGQLVARQHPRLDAEVLGEVPELDYTITIVKTPFLYDACRNQMFRDKDDSDDTKIPEEFRSLYLPDAAAPWGAETVYRLHAQGSHPLNRYLLCYTDRIVEIRFSWEPTEAQKAIVGLKLNIT